MDSVMSPATAILLGQLGGLGVLNLEGLWTRYDEPEPLVEEIIAIEDPMQATRAMQAIYAEPIKPELIGKRVAEIREAGGAGRRVALAAEHAGVRAGRGRRRGRLLRHPRHHGVGRTRLLRPDPAEPQAVHLRPRRPGDRRRPARPTLRRCT
jgi:IMP dehydrogenase/GMP reductase